MIHTPTLYRFSLAAALALAPSLIAQAQTTFTISGTVFDDANGLNDGTINGTAVTSSVLPANINLYVALINNSNLVASYSTVNISSGVNAGTYSLMGVTDSVYNVALTTAAPTVGSPLTIGLTSSLAYTGEGNLASGDGSVNGSVSIAAGSTTALTINYGIDRRPQTTSATLSSIQYNGSGRVIIPSTTFSGSDAEDGTYPNNLTNRTVNLFQASGGTLYYNGVAITFPSASASTDISNFDPTKVTLARTTGANSFSFAYSVADNAGINESVPSQVTANASALPMTLAGYSANREGQANIIRWMTASEANTAGFAVERSADGRTFTELGRIASRSMSGLSSSNISYQFEDATTGTTQAFYYRIREMAYNGQTSLSPVMRVSGSAIESNEDISISPNPARGTAQLTAWQDAAGEMTVTMTNTMGQQVYHDTWTADRGSNNRMLAAENLVTGTYFINVRTATGIQKTTRLVLVK